MTNLCAVCRREVADGDGRSLSYENRSISVHDSCYSDFEALVHLIMSTSQSTQTADNASRMDRLAKVVDGRLILVHRSFPNEQFPMLVYLARLDGAAPVGDLYTWLRQNELRVKNPSLSLLHLKEKGYVATFDQGNARFALITDQGRQALDTYISSLTQTNPGRSGETHDTK